MGVSELFLNGTSAHIRLFRAFRWCRRFDKKNEDIIKEQRKQKWQVHCTDREKSSGVRRWKKH